MKRYLIILVALLASTVAFGQSESICVVISGSDNFGKDNVMTMETDFMNYLRDQYRVRISKSSDLFKARADELRFQQTGSVDPEQVKEFGKFMGVDLLCVVSAVKSSDNAGNYSFRSVVFTVENGELRKISKYPDIFESVDDKNVTVINERELQRVDGNLLLRLSVLDIENSAKVRATLRALDDQDQNDQNSLKKQKKTANTKALGLSIIPGVGLMQKGRTGEGVAYLLGDIALVGGGVGMLAYANKQQDIMNDRNTNFDQYNTAKSNYNTAKTISYCCFGAAAALYVVNLVRSYVAEPKRIQWAIVPAMNPTSPYGPNMSVNLTLAYKF
ncbi:hypothetical protein [uncultured Rikenella sp.]|uniref:hypothetical protein n=1 Tax=uncultured Rikenella sp. TaxID=368003 RepID=UPI002619E338|nr:hypothetical protein [uncultured Rikenella sp.]